MGLTVHFSLKSCAKTADRARAQLERVRQLALDLPLESVSELRHVDVPQMSDEELRDSEHPNREDIWASTRGVAVPWTKVAYRDNGKVYYQQKSVEVRPLEILAFDVLPSPGCERATFRLARHPATVEVDYSPHEDRKYQKRVVGRYSTEWFFDWKKWDKSQPRKSPFEKAEKRVLPVRPAGWSGHDFCKTQFATEYGIPNFIRGHVALITLLERAREVPGIDLEYDDEGKYGPSTYTDDPTAPEPHYYRHEGKFSVPELVKEVGEWNGMMAALAGGLKDAIGDGVDSPMFDCANFEQLEFRGCQDPNIKPFLEAMKAVGLEEVDE